MTTRTLLMILILMNIKEVGALIVGATMTLSLAGCGNPDEGTPSAATTSTINVAAAFYPLQFAVESVGGDAVSVSSLSTPGIEPHDVELTPQQVADATQADLVVYLSGFQPAVDEAVKLADPAKVLDVAQFANLQGIDEAPGDHDEEEHDHDDFDPHFWLDPQRLVAVEEAIADKLKELSPQQADMITDNASSAADVLTMVDEEFSAGLKTCARRELFTAHSAFSYLAGRYGLEQVGVTGISPNIEPSPSRIAEVQDLAKEYGATTIFFETAASNAVASSIAQDLGLETAVLDPIELVSDQSAGEDYPAIMRSNLTAIRAANDCG